MRRILKLVGIYLVISAVVIAGLEVFYRDLRERKAYYSRSLPGQYENRTESWARPDPDLGWVFSGENLKRFKNRHYRTEGWVGAPLHKRPKKGSSVRQRCCGKRRWR